MCEHNGGAQRIVLRYLAYVLTRMVYSAEPLVLILTEHFELLETAVCAALHSNSSILDCMHQIQPFFCQLGFAVHIGTTKVINNIVNCTL